MAAFPPTGPVTALQVIKSYLYQQYSDDDNLQAFVDAFNELAQSYVTWFATVGLPVYTGEAIQGALLDWIAQGVYGLSRPSLPAGSNQDKGTYNTITYNFLVYNGRKVIGPQTYYATNDDVFKRIITWHFFKGDSKTFSVSWLKRRVIRFLNGINGTAPNVDNTYQVSVTFGLDKQVNITLLSGLRTVTGGAIYNLFPFNAVQYNQLKSTFQQLAPLQDAAIFQAAVEAAVLELPFQFTYVVNIV